MATELQILEALNTKEAAVPTANLAKELNASTEGTRKQLVRLKAKNQVKGDSQEGWLIIDAGKEALEQPPSMIDEGVTPRQKFEAIAQRIGIKEERIALAADIVWSGDYQDLKWVWEALGQADIRDDLRKVWVNAWRAYLHKGIPPELETELTGVPEAGKLGEGIQPKASARDFIIADEQPVRVGPNLGDYSLQDAKDILAIRALRGRFGGVAQAGQAGAGQAGAAASEKVSEVLTALAPYLNKSTDTEALKEMLADKLEIQKRDILSQIPQGQPGQPKSGLEQFVTAVTSLKEVGPIIRSLLGIPESPPSQNPGLPVQVAGPDGNPLIMNMGQVIDWQKFQANERRTDGTHQELMSLSKTVRENIPDGVQAILAAVKETKGGGETGAKTPTSEQQQSQGFKCSCGTEFGIPADWQGQPIKCPNPECGKTYTKEELMA